MQNKMHPVLTALAQREADRKTIEEVGFPSFVLMETAGRGAADRIERVLGSVSGRAVVCLCGRGNNGGDGFVVARVLYGRGAHVRVFVLGSPDGMTEDTARNWYVLEKLARNDASGRLQLERCEGVNDRMLHADVYVDALLGTGLLNPLREPVVSMVRFLCARPAPVVALDIPTGLHPDYGTVLGATTRADLTVAMGAYKAGLLVGEGPDMAGRIEVVDIGIPGYVIDKVQQPGCAWLTTDAAVASWLPVRSRVAHKYTAGAALVVGGTQGLTGAPVMASLGAARVGAGYVTCAASMSIQPILDRKMTEVVTVALPEREGGGVDADRSLAVLAPHLHKARALLVGPGQGREESTQEFVRRLLRQTTLPFVVDADGLYALARNMEALARHARGRWILTPHAGEFRRLVGADVDLTDRIGLASKYAKHWDCVLVLKGMPSVIGTPEGVVYVNATGGPALATAGTGDILAGLCVGLLAQGLSPVQAAVCAVHLGGAAADRYTERHAPDSMMAMDLLAELSQVRKERFV